MRRVITVIRFLDPKFVQIPSEISLLFVALQWKNLFFSSTWDATMVIRHAILAKWSGVAVAERRRCCSSFLPASFFASPLKRPSVDSRKRASGAIWGWTEKYGIVDAFRTLRAGHACCFLKWSKNCIFLSGVSGKGGSVSPNFRQVTDMALEVSRFPKNRKCERRFHQKE